jgi:hypothetical protein
MYGQGALLGRPLTPISPGGSASSSPGDESNSRLRQHYEIMECYAKKLLPGFIRADNGGVVWIAELQVAGLSYLRP